MSKKGECLLLGIRFYEGLKVCLLLASSARQPRPTAHLSPGAGPPVGQVDGGRQEEGEDHEGPRHAGGGSHALGGKVRGAGGAVALRGARGGRGTQGARDSRKDPRQGRHWRSRNYKWPLKRPPVAARPRTVQTDSEERWP